MSDKVALRLAVDIYTFAPNAPSHMTACIAGARSGTTNDAPVWTSAPARDTYGSRCRREEHWAGHTERVPELNVVGGPLEPCGTDPMPGFYRDGCCSTGPQDVGRHTICAVVTAEFLEHQRSIGNDLSTPMPQYRFPGLEPGDRWCVTAVNWLRAYEDGYAAPVVLACTHERTLDVVPIEALRENAVDVPDDLGNL